MQCDPQQKNTLPFKRKCSSSGRPCIICAKRILTSKNFFFFKFEMRELHFHKFRQPERIACGDFDKPVSCSTDPVLLKASSPPSFFTAFPASFPSCLGPNVLSKTAHFLFQCPWLLNAGASSLNMRRSHTAHF